MTKVATFEKVSMERYVQDYIRSMCLSPEECPKDIADIYPKIPIPKRATVGSAGYDFVTPTEIRLVPGQSALVCTGIRARINEGWMLLLLPRSGQGFKYRLRLENTVGLIDSDYYSADNEGHILVKMTYCKDSGPELVIPAGKAFCQGVFVPYGVTTNEADTEVTGIRKGGTGSTDTN